MTLTWLGFAVNDWALIFSTQMYISISNTRYVYVGFAVRQKKPSADGVHMLLVRVGWVTYSASGTVGARSETNIRSRRIPGTR